MLLICFVVLHFLYRPPVTAVINNCHVGFVGSLIGHQCNRLKVMVLLICFVVLHFLYHPPVTAVINNCHVGFVGSHIGHQCKVYKMMYLSFVCCCQLDPFFMHL